jgi:hypothetical protein
MEINEPLELAKKIGISSQGILSDNKYIIHLSDSDEYSRMYTLLSNSNLLHLDSENVVMTETNSELVYYTDSFTVTLSADLDADDYNITIKETNN